MALAALDVDIETIKNELSCYPATDWQSHAVTNSDFARFWTLSDNQKLEIPVFQTNSEILPDAIESARQSVVVQMLQSMWVSSQQKNENAQIQNPAGLSGEDIILVEGRDVYLGVGNSVSGELTIKEIDDSVLNQIVKVKSNGVIEVTPYSYKGGMDKMLICSLQLTSLNEDGGAAEVTSGLLYENSGQVSKRTDENGNPSADVNPDSLSKCVLIEWDDGDIWSSFLPSEYSSILSKCLKERNMEDDDDTRRWTKTGQKGTQAQLDRQQKSATPPPQPQPAASG